MITGTFFFHKNSRHKKDFELTPDALVELIDNHHKPRKDDLQWIKLAKFGDHATGKESLRNNANVLAITGVEADYDAGKIPFDDAVKLLEQARVEAIAYTSPSHKEDKPRWRILAPLSKEYPPGERERFLARLNGIFAGALGAESFTLSQSYYFGYVGNGSAPASHRAKYIAGDFIDLRNDLDQKAIGKSGKARADGNAYENHGDGYGERLDVPAAITEIVSGGDFHVPMRRIVASMVGLGTERLIVTEHAIGLYRAACLRRPELYTRGGEQEVRKIIDWTYEREEQKQKPQPQTDGKTLPPDISINDFYAYLPQHWYLYVPTQTLWPPATIGARLGKVGTVKAARWLDKERAVSQMIWAPGEPQIVKDKHLIEGGWIEKPGAIVFNQYRSGIITGGDPAQAEPWISLVKFLWPTPSEHEHIIRVLAHKIQHPAIKINHALVLGGGMRIGKDTVLVPIKQILGEWNCIEAKPTTIMSNFNGYMRSILLLINEARDLGETKRHEFYLHMKDVIATPPTTVLVNEKHEKGIHVANVCLVIMTTNHRTDGIYLPSGDGRHFPVWSERSREEYDIDYFDRFYDWLNNGGTAHVAAYLRALNVSDFRPGRPPPQTDLFHEIVQASTPLETTQIADILENWRPDVFVLSTLISQATGDLHEWLSNKGNHKSIPYRLAECGYTRIPKPGVADGRWTVGGGKQNVYGNKDLPIERRLRMAQELE